MRYYVILAVLAINLISKLALISIYILSGIITYVLIEEFLILDANALQEYACVVNAF